MDSYLFLVIPGFLIQRPTFITLAMAPVLMFTYYHLAKSEERNVENKLGESYFLYCRQVPMFWPRLRFTRKPASPTSWIQTSS